MQRCHRNILAGLMASAIALGGANIAVSAQHQHKADENCHTMGDRLCGPATNETEIARRAELARGMLAPKNALFNHYITGPNALDNTQRVQTEIDEGTVHDDLVEGCEGDWNTPFCDIVRHYQFIRIQLKTPYFQCWVEPNELLGNETLCKAPQGNSGSSQGSKDHG